MKETRRCEVEKPEKNLYLASAGFIICLCISRKQVSLIYIRLALESSPAFNTHFDGLPGSSRSAPHREGAAFFTKLHSHFYFVSQHFPHPSAPLLLPLMLKKSTNNSFLAIISFTREMFQVTVPFIDGFQRAKQPIWSQLLFFCFMFCFFFQTQQP